MHILGHNAPRGSNIVNKDSSKVVLAQMTPKERPAWVPEQKHTNIRLLRNTAFFAAVSICLGIGWAISRPQSSQAVMAHLTAGFEYDDTLGRLQFVSNMLPESAMVFLNTEYAVPEFCVPAGAQISHPWTQQEPWTEYACFGDISACQDGEIMTIVKNHAGTHTMRILHDNGYESIYSGLSAVHSKEHDTVFSGQTIGTSTGTAAFELRRDGVSVLPVFSEM